MSIPDLKNFPMPWTVRHGPYGRHRVADAIGNGLFEIVTPYVGLEQTILRAVNTHERLVDALRPFAALAEAFDRNPLNGVDDCLWMLHGGAVANPGVGADLRLSDIRAAAQAIKEATQ